MNYDENTIFEQLRDPLTRRRAFSIVVQQYTKMLYWNIRRIVVDHDDANDILQDTFMKAWNSLDGFEGKSKISTWLCRIAVNKSLDFIRHQQIVNAISPDADVSLANKLMADEYFDGDETQAQLQEVVSKLPGIQRTVFNLRYYDEMKYSEMSKLLGTTEGSLKASYHIAVKKITDFFNHMD